MLAGSVPKSLGVCAALALLCLNFPAILHAQDNVQPDTSPTYTESVLVNLTGSTGDYPDTANLIQASDGNFYGTTQEGGTYDNGTVFQLTPAGTYTVLYSFAGGASDGSGPNAGLVQATDGSLYGTTYYGGVSNLGTVFKIQTGAANTPVILYSFGDGASDGANPVAGLVQATDGSLYGTTLQGGAGNLGTVFKIQTGAANTPVILHSFGDGASDGGLPDAGLVQATDGFLYGTTYFGGANDVGAVFKIQTGAANTPVILYFFAGGASDGAYPFAGLVQAIDGSLYGTTVYGGASNFGTVFKIQTGAANTPVILHSFGDGVSDGANPYAGLVQATDGSLYGTTQEGGPNPESNGGDGTIFKIQTGAANTPVILHFFAGGASDGQNPWGLVQATDGSLYGTTLQGGANDVGTIFKLAVSPALAAPVQLTVPSSVVADASFSLSYLVYNSYDGTVPGTLNYCFATNNAGDTTGWIGIITGEPTSQTKTLTAPATAGTYTYALTCGGVESGIATLTVSASGKAGSTAALSASPNPATVGQQVTLTATVSGPGATPTGSVTFYYGSEALATVTLSSGKATLPASTATLPVGAYSLTADYSGDSNYNASTSAAYTVTLNKATTKTAVAASPNSVTPPADCTLTATIARSVGSGFATGTVTFSVNGTSIGSAKLNASGVGTLSADTAGIASGSYPVVATYGGDSSDTGSVSSAVTVVVK